MKKLLFNIMMLGIVTPTFAQSLPQDSLSYAAGVFVGENVKQMIEMSKNNFERMGIPFDEKLCLQTAMQMIEGKEVALDGQKAMTLLNNAMEKAHKKTLAENKAKGDAFLAENAKNKGIQKTASGLQYRVITKGKGAVPTKDDKVKVYYEGRTIDGKIFDSSIKRGEPTEFGVTQVIKGWTEALQLMPVGSKWEVFIPSELAYGERGAGQDIKPNEALIFTIELLDIIKKDSDSKTSTSSNQESTKTAAKTTTKVPVKKAPAKK